MAVTVVQKNQDTQSSSSQSSSSFLDWRKRPQEIQDKIEEIFQALTKRICDERWASRGDNRYSLAQISEDRLIQKVIHQAPKNQKDFYILDIGAGNFQWGRSMADFINKQKDLPHDITIHVIGVRGEGGSEEKESIGKCKIYELTAFKVENLFEEFQKRGFFLEKKVDFVISRLCFVHLVESLGTFLQTYELLRPGSGLLLMDGFYVFDKDDTWEKYVSGKSKIEPLVNLITLLLRTRVPFLLYPYAIHGALASFLLRKPNATPCLLKMSYTGIESPCEFSSIGSKCVTKFDMGDERYTIQHFMKSNDHFHTLYGDRALYLWLRKNELIPMQIQWGASKSDYVLIKDKLKIHKAVSQGNLSAIETSLNEGADIDEPDFDGNTPLQLAIKMDQYSSFNLLLERNANVNLPNYLQVCPLEEAEELEKNNEQYVQPLLQKGAKKFKKQY